MPIPLVFQGKFTEKLFQEVSPPQNSVSALRCSIHEPPTLMHKVLTYMAKFNNNIPIFLFFTKKREYKIEFSSDFAEIEAMRPDFVQGIAWCKADSENLPRHKIYFD